MARLSAPACCCPVMLGTGVSRLISGVVADYLGDVRAPC
jgi:hypothetical protein